MKWPYNDNDLRYFMHPATFEQIDLDHPHHSSSCPGSPVREMVRAGMERVTRTGAHNQVTAKDDAMLKTKPAKEVVIRVPNEIGTLNKIARIVADKGINILAVSAWVEGAQAVIRLVTDDNVRVLDALRAQHFDSHEKEVLLTESPHKPGMLHRISEKLAQEEIDIHHLYSTADAAQGHCLVVFATANNDRAMVLLNAPV